MEERLKALAAFLKMVRTEKELQEIVTNASKKLSEVGIDSNPSLSVAERLDETYKKYGMVNPEKRKFYVDLICGGYPEIGDGGELEEERRLYSKFLLFEAAHRFSAAYLNVPLY